MKEYPAITTVAKLLLAAVCTGACVFTSYLSHSDLFFFGGIAGALFGVSSFLEILAAYHPQRHAKAAASSSLRRLEPASRITRALAQADRLVNFVGSLVPPKIEEEVIGDCIERMQSMEDSGAHHFRIQVEALRTVGWALVYTVREFTKEGAILAAVWRFFFS